MQDSSILGGFSNTLRGSVGVSAIAGGTNNLICSGYTFIGGGGGNSTAVASCFSVIGGGCNNSANSCFSSILGGCVNQVLCASPFSTVLSGCGNNIQVDSCASLITGGLGNSIKDLNLSSTIGNGSLNTICRQGCFNNIANGLSNSIHCSQQFSTILNGCCNCINNSTANNFIPYGCFNTISCANSSAAGLFSCTSRYAEQAWATGSFNVPNNTHQSSDFILWNSTSNNTQTELYLNGTAATESLTLPNNSIIAANILTVGVELTTGVAAAFSEKSVLIENIGGVTTLLHQSNIAQLEHETNALLNIQISAGSSPSRLVVQVTGLAATNMRWMSYVKTNQILF